MPVTLKVKQTTSPGVGKDKTGLVTAQSQNLINKLNQDSDLFYELEPVEVLNVCLQEEDLPRRKIDGEPDYTYYGGIKGRFLLSEDNVNISSCSWFRPLMPDIQRIPVAGEVVYGYVDNGERYYLGFVHLNNSPTNMARPGISNLTNKNANVKQTDFTWDRSPMVNSDKYKPGFYYTADKDVKRPVMFEGDTILNGRFGNMIRLGSNQIDEQETSPSIKITNGVSGFVNDNLAVESIKEDLSSINMTYNEKVNLELPITSKVIQDSLDYDKSQIQVRSDRIIFTTRTDSIGLYSSDNVSIGAVNKIVMESPEVKIGDDSGTEPQVLGQILYDKLDALVTAIGGVTGIPTPTGPTPGPVSAAPNWSAVTSAMSAVKDALSDKHRIDK
jgi:hypothetical protein